MVRVDALLARIGAGFFQQAFVVADLDAAMAAFTAARRAAEHWTTFPAIGTPYRYRGRDIESSVALAFSRSGRVQIELLAADRRRRAHPRLPGRIRPGRTPHRFPRRGRGAAVAAAEADGIEAVMSGHIGTLYFVYLDTFAELGMYIELIEDPDGLIAQLTP